MLTNANRRMCFYLFIFLYFGASLDSTEIPEPQFRITAMPPRLVQYPLFNEDMDHFSVSLKSDKPVEKVQIRILFPQDTEITGEFFTNNVLWKKTENAYYLTNIFGKPAEIPLVENNFKLDVNYRFKPTKYTPAHLEILLDSKVIKSVALDFIAPVKISDFQDRLSEEFQKDLNQKIAGSVIALVLLWFLYDVFYRRRKQKNIPLCSTRARFSTLLEEDQFVKIEETRNPFGCRLGGLKKRIKIGYRNSTISISISGKHYSYLDRDSLYLDINEVWKLRIEAQNYYGNDEKSHKNLVILLLPA